MFVTALYKVYVTCPLVKGNNMFSVLAKYVINRLIHGLFHIDLVISPRFISSLGADIKVSCWKQGQYEKGHVLIYNYYYYIVITIIIIIVIIIFYIIIIIFFFLLLLLLCYCYYIIITIIIIIPLLLLLLSFIFHSFVNVYSFY